VSRLPYALGRYVLHRLEKGCIRNDLVWCRRKNQRRARLSLIGGRVQTTDWWKRHDIERHETISWATVYVRHTRIWQPSIRKAKS